MSQLLKNGCRTSQSGEKLKLECDVSPDTCCAMPEEMGGEIKETKQIKKGRELNPE